MDLRGKTTKENVNLSCVKGDKWRKIQLNEISWNVLQKRQSNMKSRLDKKSTNIRCEEHMAEIKKQTRMHGAIRERRFNLLSKMTNNDKI